MGRGKGVSNCMTPEWESMGLLKRPVFFLRRNNVSVLCHLKGVCVCVCVCVCVWLGLGRGFPDGSLVKNLTAMQGRQVQSLGREDPLEKDVATHSSILAWRIP